MIVELDPGKVNNPYFRSRTQDEHIRDLNEWTGIIFNLSRGSDKSLTARFPERFGYLPGREVFRGVVASELPFIYRYSYEGGPTSLFVGFLAGELAQEKEPLELRLPPGQRFPIIRGDMGGGLVIVRGDVLGTDHLGNANLFIDGEVTNLRGNISNSVIYAKDSIRLNLDGPGNNLHNVVVVAPGELELFEDKSGGKGTGKLGPDNFIVFASKPDSRGSKKVIATEGLEDWDPMEMSSKVGILCQTLAGSLGERVADQIAQWESAQATINTLARQIRTLRANQAILTKDLTNNENLLRVAQAHLPNPE